MTARRSLRVAIWSGHNVATFGHAGPQERALSARVPAPARRRQSCRVAAPASPLLSHHCDQLDGPTQTPDRPPASPSRRPALPRKKKNGSPTLDGPLINGRYSGHNRIGGLRIRRLTGTSRRQAAGGFDTPRPAVVTASARWRRSPVTRPRRFEPSPPLQGVRGEACLVPFARLDPSGRFTSRPQP